MNRPQRETMTREDEQHGVKLPELCAVAVLETNVDDKYLTAEDYSSSVDECKRESCTRWTFRR